MEGGTPERSVGRGRRVARGGGGTRVVEGVRAENFENWVHNSLKILKKITNYHRPI